MGSMSNNVYALMHIVSQKGSEEVRSFNFWGQLRRRPGKGRGDLVGEGLHETALSEGNLAGGVETSLEKSGEWLGHVSGYETNDKYNLKQEKTSPLH